MLTLASSVLALTLSLDPGAAQSPCPEAPKWKPYLCRSTVKGDSSCQGGLEPYCPQEGDLFFGWGLNPIGRIVFLSSRAGPPSHVGVVMRQPDGSLGAFESTLREHGKPSGVHIRPIWQRLHSYYGVIWIRRLKQPLTPEQSCALTTFALSQEGKPFAFLRSAVVPQLFNPLHGLTADSPAKPAFKNRQNWFCSELAISCYIKVGLINPHAVNPAAVLPKNLFNDQLLDLGSLWEPPVRLIWKLTPPGG